MDIIYRKVNAPQKDCALPVMLSDETMRERREKILVRMRRDAIEQLVIYADMEHGSNFMYLTGFFPRFEEALLILQKDGSSRMVLGNENLNKCGKARILSEPVHASVFSLPNQPQHADRTMKELLLDAGLMPGRRTGLVGWKLFTGRAEDGLHTYDLPSYIVDAVREIVQEKISETDFLLSNAAPLFIGRDGARTTNNANEIAHYEYGAALASDCMLDALDMLDEGVTELQLGDALVRNGQHTNVVTIAASGPRFINANMFPTQNRVKTGDPVSLTVGYSGGSSSRAGYAVRDKAQLPPSCSDYMERVAKPYFAAYVTWLEQVRVGMSGGELFDVIEKILPREKFHWNLCPGHLTAEEEWLCSPVYEGSGEPLASGMIFQIDIIPSVSGYGGVCAESTVLLADRTLKGELSAQYPDLYARMRRRRDYLSQELNIRLSEDVLPMCSSVAYLRPYLLDRTCALAVERRRD